MLIRLYGRNYGSNKKYQTDIQKWMTLREKATGSRVVNPNVDSKGKAPIFSALSPMKMGPVDCYREKGKMVTAVNVEVAWQYAKVYSHIVNKKGKLVDVSDTYIKKDASGRIIGPSKEWFAMRDKAYTNEKFRFDHPQFKKNKKRVRRAFRKNSVVCFWYWNGKMLNRDQARQQIYATIYRRFLVKTKGFKRLQEAYDRWQDIAIFDADGYDWIELGMTPVDCIKDVHSFGHGHVIAFLLQGIDPTRLVKSKGRFIPAVQRVPSNGRLPKLKLDWRKYDAYTGKQKGLLDVVAKAELERLARKILNIHPADAKQQWGEVYAPGRYATVIHVFPGIHHGLVRKAREIGFKVFNQNPKDGLKWGPRLLEFHDKQRAKMPGLPNSRVQEVIKTGSVTTPDSLTHRYLIQKWIAGDTLDKLIERGITQAEILRVLDDLFNKLIIPLWSAGTVWWDFRQNNMVLTPKRELYLIDSDVLEACAKEILSTPPCSYFQRNRKTKEALRRYRSWMLKPMLANCLGAKGKRAKQVGAKLEKLFKKHLHLVFLAPFPRNTKRNTKIKWNGKAWAKRAKTAYESFRVGIQELLQTKRQAGKSQRNTK